MTKLAPRHLVLLVALAGCEGLPTDLPLETAAPGDAPANVVDVVTERERIAFAPGETALTGERLDRFHDRLSRHVLGRGHQVLVAPGRVGDALSEARARWAVGALRRHGVTAQAAAAPPVAPPAPGDDGTGIVVEVLRVAVAVPDCPALPRVRGIRVGAEPTGILGCASTANLGLMVADPLTLVEGRPLGPADGAPNVRAVETYRAGKIGEKEGGNPIADAFAKAFGGDK